MTRFLKTAVIGYPVSHSKSPIIHNYWMEEHAVAGSYDAVPIDPTALKEGIDDLVRNGYAGFNVTVPHKQAVMSLCTSLDEAASAIGAVNTVHIGADGQLFGYNTDAYGFSQSLRMGAGYEPGDRPVMLFGAGGAARAVIHALLKMDVKKIILTNRTEENAHALSRIAPDVIDTVPWQDRNDALENAGLLVNTTSLGMTGFPPLGLSLDRLPQDAIATDIVYSPLMTDLLSAAQAKGNRTVTGIGMLMHQAAGAFRLWHGVLPSVTPELEAKVLSS